MIFNNIQTKYATRKITIMLQLIFIH